MSVEGDALTGRMSAQTRLTPASSLTLTKVVTPSLYTIPSCHPQTSHTMPLVWPCNVGATYRRLITSRRLSHMKRGFPHYAYILAVLSKYIPSVVMLKVPAAQYKSGAWNCLLLDNTYVVYLLSATHALMTLSSYAMKSNKINLLLLILGLASFQCLHVCCTLWV